VARRCGRILGVREWQLARPRARRGPEAARDEVGDLLGDRTVRGDLSADHRERAVDAVTPMVVERVLARDVAFGDTLLADERADAGPGEVDAFEGRAREGPGGFGPKVVDVLGGRLDGLGIPAVVRIGRPHDRVAVPGKD